MSITIDDTKLRSNLKINHFLRFIKKSYFNSILDFTQSDSRSVGGIEGFVPIIAGFYKSSKPTDLTGIDKVHLKCDCINRFIVNGNWEPILYSFALDKPPGHKTYKEPKIKLLKRINSNAFSHITIYLEDDDHKLVDFKGKAISFTCQFEKNMILE